jgi:hypothetical protein
VPRFCKNIDSFPFWKISPLIAPKNIEGHAKFFCDLFGLLEVDGAVLRHPVGNPKRKVCGAQQQVSLSCETKVYQTSRRKPNLRR